MAKPQVPQVNMNGTSKNALIEQLLDVNRAGRALLEALGNATPHGRDYQTLPPGAYLIARDQHMARQLRVQELMDDVEAMALEISNQGK